MYYSSRRHQPKRDKAGNSTVDCSMKIKSRMNWPGQVKPRKWLVDIWQDFLFHIADRKMRLFTPLGSWNIGVIHKIWDVEYCPKSDCLFILKRKMVYP